MGFNSAFKGLNLQKLLILPVL